MPYLPRRRRAVRVATGGKGGMMESINCGQRMSAKQVLISLIEKQKRELAGLEALLKTIEWEKLDRQIEESIWEVFWRIK
jgi:hypothetical protein